MKAVGHDQNGNFALTGICPFPDCNRPSTFVRIQSTNLGIIGSLPSGQSVVKWVAVLQCQGCRKYILGLAQQNQGTLSYTYLEHYPMGSPNDNVASEIPTHISADFKEALRCLFVNAYNATAEMCRRALEASCIDLGIPKGIRVLEDMIDSLEEQRKITPHMKNVAHKIRLGGNRAAHPPEGGPKPASEAPDEYAPVEIIGGDHAEAIVDYTRQFLHHVYVVPKQLEKYDFSKPKVTKL
jgi:hypothetical protein